MRLILLDPVVTSRITLEVSVTTPDEAVRAGAAGADRLELCAALEVGGVTPSAGTLLRSRERLESTPIYVLVRPRTGDFCYSDFEFDTILRDADWFMSNGADGIVCGVLNSRGQIDDVRSLELIHASRGKCVFHRAFDFMPDQFVALEHLIELGFERVLTSGGETTALTGAARIAELVRRAAGRIEILPGAGINPENVAELIRATGCTQIHGSFRAVVTDQTFTTNPALAAQMGQRMTTDAEQVRTVRAILDNLTAADSGLRHPSHGQ